MNALERAEADDRLNDHHKRIVRYLFENKDRLEELKLSGVIRDLSDILEISEYSVICRNLELMRMDYLYLHPYHYELLERP